MLETDGASVVASLDTPTPMVGLGEQVFVGERTTGRIFEVIEGRQVTRLSLGSVDGQRGLLGLALVNERLFAAYVDVDDRIVVAEVDTGRLIYLGPKSAELANGGHLAVAPDGSLVLGIGDLQSPDLVDDTDTPNGKLLALDVDGPPNQRPKVLSAGWNNPFAFAFDADGRLWVADNAPSSSSERIARGDVGARPTDVIELDGEYAPSALLALTPPGHDTEVLLMCSYLDETVYVVEIDVNGQLSINDGPLDVTCSAGLATANGELYSAHENKVLRWSLRGG